MKELFADAGYWIALFHPHDQLHLKAIAVSRDIKEYRIVTSQAVLTEFLNHTASFGSRYRENAARVVNNLHQNSDSEIILQTPELFDEALILYSQRLDKGWGLTDCSSFIIMQQRNIREVLAYDEHFAQAGFLPLLRG